MTKGRALLAMFPLLLAVVACSPIARLPAVPNELTTKAEIPGIPGARFWGDASPERFLQAGLESVRREKEYLTRTGHRGPLPPAIFLAVSGGGDDGAFGAGLLVGWTKAGNRPKFKVVTGVSTGALIAPLAFLGPKYDATLRKVFTSITPGDVFKERPLLVGIFQDGMADNRPLLRTIGRYFTKDMLDEIAREYKRGRLLLIATTNLDARRSVIWDMGAIAASGHPNALKLFRRILWASAAIPGAFSPVMFDVEVGGIRYQEMHVDGGARDQVFLYPASLELRKEAKARGLTRKRAMYIIRNARVDPEWASVERQTLSIAGRAISSLIESQGRGDLFRLYLEARRDGIDYNLAHIPKTFNAEHREAFDRKYMRALFKVGHDMAAKGYKWSKTPPGYVVTLR